MRIRGIHSILFLASLASSSLAFGQGIENGSSGPLGQWPDFEPQGFITAPHPDFPSVQPHLYGDWGSIVGEEFLFLQDGKLELLYHTPPEHRLPVRADVRERPGRGVPATGFQRTPCLLVDECFGRYILAYNAGWDTTQPHRRRTHIAVASRPSKPSVERAPFRLR